MRTRPWGSRRHAEGSPSDAFISVSETGRKGQLPRHASRSLLSVLTQCCATELCPHYPLLPEDGVSWGAGRQELSLMKSAIGLVEEEERWLAHDPDSRETIKTALPVPWMPKDPLTNWKRCLARAPFEVPSRFFFYNGRKNSIFKKCIKPLIGILIPKWQRLQQTWLPRLMHPGY